jgi:hypothetical protein
MVGAYGHATDSGGMGLLTLTTRPDSCILASQMTNITATDIIIT